MSDETGAAVDFAYLESFVGDRAVVKEVLSLFRTSVDVWAPRLTTDDPGWRDVVHTMKGSGLGIGANRLGALCIRAETEGASVLPEIRQALAEAAAAIDAYMAS